MRLFNELIYDDVLAVSGAAGFNFWFFPFPWERICGGVDTLCFFIVADNVSGASPTLRIGLNEGPNSEDDQSEVKVLLDFVPLSATQNNVFQVTYSEADSVFPPSRDVFMVMGLGGTDPRVHLRIWATGRGSSLNVPAQTA